MLPRLGSSNGSHIAHHLLLYGCAERQVSDLYICLVLEGKLVNHAHNQTLKAHMHRRWSRASRCAHDIQHSYIIAFNDSNCVTSLQ